MAFTSRFFGSAGGDPREYTQAQFAQWDRAKLDDGFVPDEGNELEVLESIPAALSVDIETGQGFVQGFFVDNDALEEDLVIGAAHATLDRIDTVVLNLDILSTRLITPVVVQGTPAGSPVPPTLTQDTNTWQVAQADVLVVALATTIAQADITDRRTPVTGKHLHDNIANDNVLINSNFSVNQREVTGSVVLASGEYGHDRFKAGSGGCTYTFATSQNITTITISAGTLIQEVLGENLQTSTYILHWQGTTTGRIDAASFTTSSQTGSLTGGTNATVEFGIGTLILPKLEIGTIKTTNIPKLDSNILRDCHVYYIEYNPFGEINPTISTGTSQNTTTSFHLLQIPVRMRIQPTLIFSSNTHFQLIDRVNAPITFSSIEIWTPPDYNNGQSLLLRILGATGLTTFRPYTMGINNVLGRFALDAEV